MNNTKEYRLPNTQTQTSNLSRSDRKKKHTDIHNQINTHRQADKQTYGKADIHIFICI